MYLLKVVPVFWIRMMNAKLKLQFDYLTYSNLKTYGGSAFFLSSYLDLIKFYILSDPDLHKSDSDPQH